MHLSVVIPAYNEEKRIATTLLDIDKYLSEQKYDYEIIVISDGSKDNTAQVVNKMGELIRNLRLIDNKENHGKGWVVKQAMLEAKGKYRLFMDADNSTPIDHLDGFWPYIKKDYDIVIGSIEVKGAKIKETAAWYRRLLGRLAKYIIRIVTGLWEIHDSQRGFKLFTDKAVDQIFLKQTLNRWGFDFEILSLAKKMGFKTKELPVDWNNPPGAVTLMSYLKTFWELLKIKWNFLTDKYKINEKK
ncbi:glycosyltransferase family 2 protein [Patescibacteria group bacterium]|nr:glycosyltransferase family 2 protein [Patescibacteria group bacterium]MBU4458455.1 glycosyltransferase family 2 protein [Patescibacteria group bacterium]